MNDGALARSRISAERDRGQLDGRALLPPLPSTCPACRRCRRGPRACGTSRSGRTLDTTSFTIRQVRPSMCVGNGSTQMPVQPSSSSALVFEPIVPWPDPTSRKNPLVTPGNILTMHPLVLADLRRIGRTAADRFLPGQRKRLQQREIAAHAIGVELLADFDPARAARHHGDRGDDETQHDEIVFEQSHDHDCIDPLQQLAHL